MIPVTYGQGEIEIQDTFVPAGGACRFRRTTVTTVLTRWHSPSIPDRPTAQLWVLQRQGAGRSSVGHGAMAAVIISNLRKQR